MKVKALLFRQQYWKDQLVSVRHVWCHAKDNKRKKRGSDKAAEHARKICSL